MTRAALRAAPGAAARPEDGDGIVSPSQATGRNAAERRRSDGGAPLSDETTRVRAAVEAALRVHDKPAAVRAAVEAVSAGRVGVDELYRDVLLPLLVDLGALWQRGERHVWEEHLASAAARTIVELVYPQVLKLKAAATPSGRSVLLACPPQEAHDLGLRIVADRFEMAGWTAYFLGADTPPEEIADAARELGVDAVALSSSTHFHRVAVRHLVDGLRHALPGVDVWIGGPAFTHDREGWAAEELLDLEALLGECSSGVAASADPGPPDAPAGPAAAVAE